MREVSLEYIQKEAYKEVKYACEEWNVVGKFTKAVIRHIGAAYALADLYDEFSQGSTSLAYEFTEMDLFKEYKRCKVKDITPEE